MLPALLFGSERVKSGAAFPFGLSRTFSEPSWSFEDMEDFESFDMAEFIAGCTKRFCPRCGTAISENTNGRPRIYCSDRCKWADDKRRYRQRRRMEYE